MLRVSSQLRGLKVEPGTLTSADSVQVGRISGPQAPSVRLVVRRRQCLERQLWQVAQQDLRHSGPAQFLPFAAPPPFAASIVGDSRRGGRDVRQTANGILHVANLLLHNMRTPPVRLKFVASATGR